MKKNFLKLALAVLTVGLLGSCSKLNERLDNLDKRVDGIENNQIASIEQQIAGINTSINDLKSADAAVNSKIAELKKTAEAQQTLIDALKEADQAIGRKDDELEGRIVILEGQDDVIAGQIEALEDADKAINDRIANLKSYVDAELVKVNDWAKATFATLAQYQQTADDLAALSVTVSGISTTLLEVQTSIAGLDTKIDGIDAALQGKIAEAKTELEGKIAALRTELEGKIASAISTSETSLKGWVNNKLGAYYTAAQMDAKIAGLRSEINNLKGDEEAGNSKTAELETKLTQLTQDLAAAKTNIKAAYEAAIAEAINTNNGIIDQTIQTKINEVNVTITNLTDRVTELEEKVRILTGRMDAAEEKINTIEQQIVAINQSISDLETIRTNIQDLMEAKEAMGDDISELQAADLALEGKITDLKNYVDTELANYATTEWANATFATLAKQEEIIADVAKLKQDLEGLDTKLDQAVADLETSLKEWVNEQLNAYYTTAEMDAKIAELQSAIDALEGDNETNKSKIEELEAELTQLTKDLEDAKTTIKEEYEAAIATAIEEYNGTITQTIQTKIDEVNATIFELTGRVDELALAVSTLQADVDDLKAMIQSVTILPAYTDGSVEAKEGTLTIDFVVSPAAALAGVTKDSIKVLVHEAKVMTKTVSYTTLEVASAVVDETAGNVTITADISEIVPSDGKGLTVAVNVKNGLSDFTSEFVPVYVYAAPTPVIPEGALPGKFTVNAGGKQVYFSKGNLYADGDKALHFEANQYSSASSWNASHVSHFTWSSTVEAAVGNSNSGDYLFCDESHKVSVDGGEAIYYALSKDEWTYLFSNHSYKWASVNGVNGYVIAPDNVTLQAEKTSYTANELNDAKLVFLPAAGGRSTSNVNGVGVYGTYGSSTAYSSSDACRVFFNNSQVSPDANDFRSSGYSVRLVTESAGGDAPEVKVTGVTMSKEETTIIVGNKETLVATVAPANATNKKITWSSSKPSVATVDKNGVVTGVAAGSANIFAITADGNFIAVCQVTVKPTTGTAKRTGDIDVNWVQLWKDGPKFAEYNVGVTDGKAESYGGYYTWGGTYKNGEGIIWNDDDNTGFAPLIGSDDTATNLWGENWRMPKQTELQALLDNCTVEWTAVGGKNGRKFTGKGAYASNSVFLPAAGYCSSGDVLDQGNHGYYWSSAPNGSSYAYYLSFTSGYQLMDDGSRDRGVSVRAVLKE